MPPWFNEFGRVDRKAIAGMYCGSACKTVKQLKRWFTEREYLTLRQHGYRAVKMKPGRIIAESDIQCFFERAKPLRKGVEYFELYNAQ